MNSELEFENVTEEKILIQIIDMSDKILYDDIKAEKHYLKQINAIISHEFKFSAIIKLKCCFG